MPDQGLPDHDELRWPSYVLGRLHRASRAVVEQGLAEVGLNLREYLVLTHVEDLRHGSQQEVADRAHLDRSDLVKVLDGLEQQALVTRKRDPTDRRRHVLALTAAGRRTLQRANRASELATGRAFAALTEQELRTLHRLALKALGQDQAGA